MKEKTGKQDQNKSHHGLQALLYPLEVALRF